MKGPSMGPNMSSPVPPTVKPAPRPSSTATAPSGLNTGTKGPVRTLGGDMSAKGFARQAGAK